LIEEEKKLQEHYLRGTFKNEENYDEEKKDKKRVKKSILDENFNSVNFKEEEEKEEFSFPEQSKLKEFRDAESFHRNSSKINLFETEHYTPEQKNNLELELLTEKTNVKK